MPDQFSRTRMLLGEEGIDKLQHSKVAIFGIGGVGGYVAEALARSGVGSFVLVDDDKVCLTNINRQIIALRSTVGKDKVEVMRDRILDINPKAEVEVRKCFFLPENADEFPFSEYDYVVDAVDTVTAKIELIMRAKESGTPIISSMGAGGRLDPSQVCYGTLATTQGDGLARTLRTRLRKMNVAINNIEVVWSRELPERRAVIELMEQNKRSSFGTLATIPALFGIYMANKIIREITGI